MNFQGKFCVDNAAETKTSQIFRITYHKGWYIMRLRSFAYDQLHGIWNKPTKFWKNGKYAYYSFFDTAVYLCYILNNSFNHDIFYWYYTEGAQHRSEHFQLSS